RGWGPMAPKNFPGRSIHRQELAEIASGVRMLVVSSANRSRAAPSCDLLHRPERGFLAVQVHRNVQRARLRTECHGAPALEAGRARAHVGLPSQLRDLVRAVEDFSGLRVHFENRLITKIARMNELAGRSVELPENPQLAHLEQRLAASDI